MVARLASKLAEDAGLGPILGKKGFGAVVGGVFMRVESGVRYSMHRYSVCK